MAMACCDTASFVRSTVRNLLQGAVLKIKASATVVCDMNVRGLRQVSAPVWAECGVTVWGVMEKSTTLSLIISINGRDRWLWRGLRTIREGEGMRGAVSVYRWWRPSSRATLFWGQPTWA